MQTPFADMRLERERPLNKVCAGVRTRSTWTRFSGTARPSCHATGMISRRSSAEKGRPSFLSRASTHTTTFRETHRPTRKWTNQDSIADRPAEINFRKSQPPCRALADNERLPNWRWTVRHPNDSKVGHYPPWHMVCFLDAFHCQASMASAAH